MLSVLYRTELCACGLQTWCPRGRKRCVCVCVCVYICACVCVHSTSCNELQIPPPLPPVPCVQHGAHIGVYTCSYCCTDCVSLLCPAPSARAGSHRQAPVGHRHGYCPPTQQDHHCHWVCGRLGPMHAQVDTGQPNLLCWTQSFPSSPSQPYSSLPFPLPSGFIHLSRLSPSQPSPYLSLPPLLLSLCCSENCIQFFELSNFEPYCQLAYLENLAMKLDFWYGSQPM